MVIQRLTVSISCQKRCNSLKTELDRFLNILDRHTRNLARDQRGATAIEYGLIAGLLAVFLIGAIGVTGLNVDGLYGDSVDEITDIMDDANNEN